jgi:hypothetical protein
MTINFEGIIFVIKSAKQCLVQGRQALTSNINDGAMNLFDDTNRLCVSPHSFDHLVHLKFPDDLNAIVIKKHGSDYFTAKTPLL